MGPLGLPCSPALAALSTSPAPASASSSSRLPPCRPPIFSLGRKLRRFRSELRCSTSSTVSDIDSSSSGLGSSPASSSDASERTKNDIDAQVFVSRYEADEPRKGCDVLVEALERAGVDTVFAYPGGASMEIHQALTRTDRIRNILCRHEQGNALFTSQTAKPASERQSEATWPQAHVESVLQFVADVPFFYFSWLCVRLHRNVYVRTTTSLF